MVDIPTGTLIVGVICAIVGVVLGTFLNRLNSKIDKSDTTDRDLELRVAKLENDQKTDQELQWYRMREHVGSEYATRLQVEALSSKMDNTLGRIERMIVPVFKRLYPDASIPE
jgi:uncharacterized membrane-anchored protein YhcB (DUF1043 family)